MPCKSYKLFATRSTCEILSSPIAMRLNDLDASAVLVFDILSRGVHWLLSANEVPEGRVMTCCLQK